MPRSVARSVLVVLSSLVMGVVAFVAPAAASTGNIGGRGADYFFDNGFDGSADVRITYGRDADAVLVGDWNGDGIDTLAVRRGRVYHLRNSLTSGPASTQIAYGRENDTVLVGDWDGDGVDTLAVRRGNTYHLRNSLTSGPADSVIRFGRAGDDVLVGDWDGDGIDTFAVRRGTTYFVSNSLTSGNADQTFTYGRADDSILVGDFDGNGTDTLAARRGNIIYASDRLDSSVATVQMSFGRASDRAFAGDFDGDGVDTFALRRPPAPPPTPPAPTTNGGLVGAPPYAGSGTFAAVPGSSAAGNPNASRIVRVRVETERGIGVDRPEFGRLVMSRLNDTRGWGRYGAVSFARTDGPADVVLRLTTPATVDRLCHPLDTRGYTSCRRGNQVIINVNRWAYGAAPFTSAGGSLNHYRDYVVNHEMGHYLGHGHASCGGAGRLAPVMQQQTLFMNGCRPNGWPYP
ncbi:Alkaline phosphatase [Actinomycetales bacterium JB111]|nr:Alkaline phosphatase [Actinomycetales bacterium JB111]